MPSGGGAGGGGGGGCGGGGGGFSGGGFHSYNRGYSGCSTTHSSSYHSSAGRSTTRNHISSPSNSSASVERRANKPGNMESPAASQLNKCSSVDQQQARTDQINNKSIGRSQRSLIEKIYQCIGLCLACSCGCFCAIFCFAAPFVLVFLIGTFSPSSSDIATNFFSPGDSRLISFSSFFCEGVDLKVDSVATDATVFLLDVPPPLSDMNNFTVIDSRTLDKLEFRFWQYYLYSDANISVSVCSDKLDIYIVQGNSNANDWARKPGRQHAKRFYRVTNKCPQQQSFDYTVEEEDQYYIIFHNPSSKRKIRYNLNLSIERFEYNIESGNYSAVCHAPSGSQCSVDIPYHTGSQLALVVTSIPVDVDWGENVDIKSNCNRRDWAYTVVILSTILVFVTVLVIFVAYLIYCRVYIQI